MKLKLSKPIHVTMIAILAGILFWGCDQKMEKSGAKSGRFITESAQIVEYEINTSNLAHINCFKNENETPVFLGDGEVFNEGKEIPLIAYSTNADGAVTSLGVLVTCPFIKLNPAILDYSKLDNFNSIAAGVQIPDEGGIEATFRIKSHESKVVFIDSSYVVFPISEEKSHYKGQNGGPFLTLLFRTPDDQKIIWEKVSVSIEGVESGQIQSIITAEGELLISVQSREKLRIVLRSEDSQKEWSYDLFPIFRGATQSVVTCLLPNVPI